jgi:peroxiredoxin
MNQSDRSDLAPALDTVAWINTLEPLILSELKGKVVVIHAFQMLCPGCVAHGIPQATTIHHLYAKEAVQVIGLHTVFEHHDVMTIDALKVFVEEYRITFPIAIDTPSDSGFIPKTMASYQMKGTPTLIVLDKSSRVRLNHFGRISDMQVGSLIGSLLAETSELSLPDEKNDSSDDDSIKKCGDDGCST